MRIFIALLVGLIVYSCQAQHRKVQTISVNINVSELKKQGAFLGRARFLAVNDSMAIGQIGMVDIVLLDLQTGKIVKSINTEEITKALDEYIKCLQGEEYFVPDKQENMKSNYVGTLAYDYRGLLYYDEKAKFATQMVTTVFNRNDESNQVLFPALVLFDKNLENIEIIPFKPGFRSTNSDWSNGGFFMGTDRMFTKMMAWQHTHNFDFLGYRLNEDRILTLEDTIFGIKTDTVGYTGRWHGCFVFNGHQYLNLGTSLYSFAADRIREGSSVELPNAVKRKYVQIEPVRDTHLAAFTINNYRNDPNPTGWLVLLNKEFRTTTVIDTFDLRNVEFCSLFSFGESVFVVGFSVKGENYFIRKYSVVL